MTRTLHHQPHHGPGAGALMELAALGVGPQRTGTTWLWECLRAHPDLCLPRGVKETTFFDARFDAGWPWYAAHFAHRRPGQRCMEIGATYFEDAAAAARVRLHAPECRVVVTLRDPAARTYSLYLHHARKGRLRGDFDRALVEQPWLLDGSRYRVHLERWRALFGPGRVAVVLLDDVVADPGAVLARVQAFLGVRALPPPPAAFERINGASLPAHRGLARAAARAAARLHGAGWHTPVAVARRLGLHHVYGGRAVPALDPTARARLIAALEPDIAFVETLLGRPLPAWRTAAGAAGGDAC
jgi:hypothetical protein